MKLFDAAKLANSLGEPVVVDVPGDPEKKIELTRPFGAALAELRGEVATYIGLLRSDDPEEQGRGVTEGYKLAARWLKRLGDVDEDLEDIVTFLVLKDREGLVLQGVMTAAVPAEEVSADPAQTFPAGEGPGG